MWPCPPSLTFSGPNPSLPSPQPLPALASLPIATTRPTLASSLSALAHHPSPHLTRPPPRPHYPPTLTPQVGGDKYFNVYCPDYGIDLRIHTNLMGVPTRSSWTAGARTLIIDHAGGAGKGNGTTGQAKGRGNASGQGQRQGSGATPGEGGEEGAEKLDPCSSHFDYQEWVDHLAAIGRKTQAAVDGAVSGSGLDNPRHLMPAMLPLQVRGGGGGWRGFGQAGRCACIRTGQAAGPSLSCAPHHVSTHHKHVPAHQVPHDVQATTCCMRRKHQGALTGSPCRACSSCAVRLMLHLLV